MKNVLLVAVATLFSCSLFAQNLPIPTVWKVKKIGVSVGVDRDMINNLDYNYLLQTTTTSNLDRFQNLDIDESNYFGGVCENPQFRVTATLEVPGLRNTELNVGLQGTTGRYDGVYYNNYNSDGTPKNDGYEYLSVTSMTSEIGLESSMTKRVSLGFINLYAGGGTNLGYSFGGHMDVSGHQNITTVEQDMDRSLRDIGGNNTYETSTYSDAFESQMELKNSFHQRVFAQIGVGIVVRKRLEIGLDLRRGIGYRAVFDGPFRTTQLHSAALSARWILRN